MVAASITDNNTIFDELIHKYSGKTYSYGMYRLEEASIENQFHFNQGSSNMIRCLYKREHANGSGFVLKIEDAREKMACSLNQMMDLHKLPNGTTSSLPEEIIQIVAKFLGSSELKTKYTPNDFPPCYQLAYKGPLPEFITYSDLMKLYELGHVDLVKSMFYNGDYFVMSDESFNSGLNPKVYWYFKNIDEMRCGIEKTLEYIKELYQETESKIDRTYERDTPVYYRTTNTYKIIRYKYPDLSDYYTMFYSPIEKECSLKKHSYMEELSENKQDLQKQRHHMEQSEHELALKKLRHYRKPREKNSAFRNQGHHIQGRRNYSKFKI
jgi:hypothetical protein